LEAQTGGEAAAHYQDVWHLHQRMKKLILRKLTM